MFVGPDPGEFSVGEGELHVPFDERFEFVEWIRTTWRQLGKITRLYVVEQRQQDVAFAGEVPVDRGTGGAGGLGDLVDRDGVKSTLVEQ